MDRLTASSRGLLEANQLLAVLDAPALIVDNEGYITEINRAIQTLCESAGYSLCCGVPISELLPNIGDFWPDEMRGFDTGYGVQCAPDDALVCVRGTPLCSTRGTPSGWLVLVQTREETDGQSAQRLRSLLASMDDLVILVNPEGLIMEFYQPAGESVVPSDTWMLGKYYYDVFPESTARKFTEIMDRVRKTGTTHRYDQLVLVNGKERWYSANMGLLRDGDKDASGFLIVARDITERKRIETAEREQRVLAEALQDVALTLSSTLNLDEIWEHILSNVVRVVPADAAAILLVDEDKARVVGERGYTERGIESCMVGRELPFSVLTRLQHMIQTHEPYLIADTRASHSWGYSDGDGTVAAHNQPQPWARSYLGAPILLDEEVIGFIKLESAVANYFTPKDAERLHAFGSHAASAIRNASLYSQAQELAALEERQRLARDLHDAVSQMLFSAKIIAEMLPRLRDREPESVWTYLPELGRLIQGAMGEMRMLLLELRPTILTDVDLGVLLGYLVDAASARTSAKVSLTVRDSCHVVEEVQIALYRIAQEALANAVKHAHASTIDVTLQCDGELVSLQVADDGSGFESSEVRPENLGLSIMHERADEIGARLSVEGTSSGTVVNVEWNGEIQSSSRAMTANDTTEYAERRLDAS